MTDYTTFLLSVHQGDPERMVFQCPSLHANTKRIVVQCPFTQTPRALLVSGPSHKHEDGGLNRERVNNQSEITEKR